MKILHITSLYPSYLSQFYAKNPGLKDASFTEQRRKIFCDFFAIGDAWTTGLRDLGYEAGEILFNADSLQQAWWRENCSRLDPGSADPLQIAIRQAKSFGPDVLLFDESSEELLRGILSEVPSIRLVLGWVGSAFPKKSGVYRHIDLMLSCAPESVADLRGLGIKAEQLHHAFDSRILSQLGPETEPSLPVSFIGQIIRGSQFHNYRSQLLEMLCEQVEVEIFSELASLGWTDVPRTIVKSSLYHSYRWGEKLGLTGLVDTLPLLKRQKGRTEAPRSQRNARLQPFLRPACYGLEMYRTIRNSRVTLNIHADSSPRFASNMRLFESTGVGSCLLTDWRENLSELFEPGTEVVAYKSPEECCEMARWLLDNPVKAGEIAAAGKRRTLRDHNYQNRVQQLDRWIKARI